MALAVYDDGGGAHLYPGGEFTTAGGVTVNNIARWDGNAWRPLSGPAGTGTAYQVQAASVYADVGGPALHVGGDFLRAGGTPVHDVARWNGGGWSALAGPTGIGVGPAGLSPDNVFVAALAVWDDGGGPALYAGGGFRTAGGLSSRNIARWLCTDRIFADGLESGDVSAWSGSSGGP
jgi:hypothetical protein